MNRRDIFVPACAIALVALMAGPARAQTSGKWTDRLYVQVDAGAQLATPGFTSNVTFKLNGEDGTFTARYRFVSAIAVAARAGVRVGGNLGLGLGVSRFVRQGEATVAAALPHPFFFNRPRNVTGVASDLKREETMVSAELAWLLRPRRKIDVMLFAGPAYFTTRQAMATRPRYTETYPFDTATFVGVDAQTVNKSGVGFTAGFDVSCLLSKHLGLGSLIRYSRATTTFSAASGSNSSVTLGGIQASAGLRIRF